MNPTFLYKFNEEESYLYPPVCEKSVCILIATAAIMVVLPVICYRATHNIIFMDMLLSNNNPLILGIAASVTMILQRKQFHSAIINWLASSTLAIYLITDSGSLRKPIMTWLLEYIMNDAVFGYILLVAVCLSCVLVDKVRNALLSPLNDRLTQSIFALISKYEKNTHI